MRAAALLLAVLMLVAGCRSTQEPIDQPALLRDDDAAGRAEITEVLTATLGVERLRLSDRIFDTSSVLLIERSVPRDLQAQNPLGRNLETPERFTLVVNADGCALVRQRTQQRWQLLRARCVRNPEQPK